MKRFVLFGLGLALVFTSIVNADPAPVCLRDSTEMNRITRDSTMRLSFENDGGLGNGGVCWWHSRFQRAAWYLADFHPEKPKPSDREATRIIHRFAHLEGVIEVPGYSDFSSFSKDFEPLIQRELNQWQIRDGFINQAWIRGLSRKSEYNPRRAAQVMAKLYEDYLGDRSKNHVPWVKLQMPGLVAHAALILSIVRDAEANYTIEAVDSNFPDEIKTWNFEQGDTHIETIDYEKMMPFDGYERDLNKIDRSLRDFCHRN